MTSDHDEQIGIARPLVSIETRGRHPTGTVNSSDFPAAYSAAVRAERDLFHRSDDDVPRASTSNPTSESPPSRTRSRRVFHCSDSLQPATALPCSLLTSTAAEAYSNKQFTSCLILGGGSHDPPWNTDPSGWTWQMRPPPQSNSFQQYSTVAVLRCPCEHPDDPWRLCCLFIATSDREIRMCPTLRTGNHFM